MDALNIKKIDSELLEESLKVEVEELKKCAHCGATFTWFTLPAVLGRKPAKVQVPTCECIEELEEKEKARKEKEAKDAKLKKLFENSLMTPLFRKKTFKLLEEKAVEYGNKKELEICKKYAKEFNRETSAGICMIGKPGTGKTTLLAAICNELLEKNHSCLFITMSALFDKFTKYSYDNAGDISGLLNWLTEFDFIVLDDIGRGGESEKRQEVAYRIIDTLLNYEVPTCVTANPEMLAIIDSFPAWRAIIDRLKDMCEIRIEFKGSTNRGRKWQ